MDDEKIYKAAKLEWHVAVDSGKTKDFAFDCAIIEAIKQARADERYKTLHAIVGGSDDGHILYEAERKAYKKGQAKLIAKIRHELGKNQDDDNALSNIDDICDKASESLGAASFPKEAAARKGECTCGHYHFHEDEKCGTLMRIDENNHAHYCQCPASNPKPENACEHKAGRLSDDEWRCQACGETHHYLKDFNKPEKSKTTKKKED